VLAEGFEQLDAVALRDTSLLANTPPLMSNSTATAAQGKNAAVDRSMSGHLHETPVRKHNHTGQMGCAEQKRAFCSDVE